jgi:hypothetical protein
MLNRRIVLMTVSALALMSPLSGVGPSFHPDVTFKGSALTGWHMLGDAS